MSINICTDTHIHVYIHMYIARQRERERERGGREEGAVQTGCCMRTTTEHAYWVSCMALLHTA